MIEIAQNLNLKVKLADINYSSGSLDEKMLMKKINKRLWV